eukprot:CAMPEP_0113859472 /NCGR_PEP_ID=MMETSP0372-20130328/12396_1 /TAXON_ID=340204 /ORGANISM="Lankesteria abbotti" /LENGTH=192 /DNA_ID=CAMNT_0000837759 /DNA_START=418 /DNA_END=996 /DNA_ORIENTATION=- /assembly_acc=CAM_ASM_000359
MNESSKSNSKKGNNKPTLDLKRDTGCNLSAASFMSPRHFPKVPPPPPPSPADDPSLQPTFLCETQAWVNKDEAGTFVLASEDYTLATLRQACEQLSAMAGLSQSCFFQLGALWVADPQSELVAHPDLSSSTPVDEVKTAVAAFYEGPTLPCTPADSAQVSPRSLDKNSSLLFADVEELSRLLAMWSLLGVNN